MGKSSGKKIIRIGILTTSRADWGIYLPLVRKLRKDTAFKLFIFAGGMHLDKRFGFSSRLIEKEGFRITEKISSLKPGYEENDINLSIAETIRKFSPVWEKYRSKMDILFALGDRYEMFAACTASVPFNIKIAHLHGGEITLGAIDNTFRNAISCMSALHFVSTKEYSDRVKAITGSPENIYNVGSLGVEGFLNEKCYSSKEFSDKFGFDILKPFVLTTIQPETIHPENNRLNIGEFLKAARAIDLPFLCTLPNADTSGNVIREGLLKFEKEYPGKLKCYENLGQKGYYTAMKNCALMIGNTSSGIIEAGAFKKKVINLGDRQKGRLSGKNVITVPFRKEKICNAVRLAGQLNLLSFKNPYGQGGASDRILKILKSV